jgi:multidrug resistance efflux pump
MQQVRGKWIPIAAGVVLFAAIMGVVVLRGRRHPVKAPAPASAAAAITAANNEVTLQGKIRPQHVKGVTPMIGGFIEAFLAEPGQEVYEGQVLAKIGAQGLESAREVAQEALERAQEAVVKAEAVVNAAKLEVSRAEADVQRSRAALDRAERASTRQQTLFKEGATPRIVYEKTVKEYEAALKDYDIVDAAVRTGREHVQAGLKDVENAKKIVADKLEQLDDAQDNLANAEVHSPTDGYIVSRKGEVGGTAGASDEIFQIATDLFALEVTVEAKPEVAKRIVPGMPALVLMLDMQSNAMNGVVREVKDNQVTVEFTSALPTIKPGMTADVRFKLE